jgi:hypothetical protein
MPPLTLTPAELLALTGYSQGKRQAAWLAARGWVFEAPNRPGDHPKVDRAYYLARMSGQPQSGQKPARARPNVNWMQGATS